MGVAPARLVSAQFGIQAQQTRYLLKHIGAITINKVQGTTLPLGIAVEISQEYSPWEAGHIVVGLSRSTTMNKTIMVGDRTFTINKMWELITMFDQWTQYTQHVLDIISASREENA